MIAEFDTIHYHCSVEEYSVLKFVQFFGQTIKSKLKIMLIMTFCLK